MDGLSIFLGASFCILAFVGGGIIFSSGRADVARDCKRDGYAWIEGTRYECKAVKP